MSLSSLARMARRKREKQLPRPQGWVKVLGRPLSAIETEALHGTCVPCSGFIRAVQEKKCHPGGQVILGRPEDPETWHPLTDWWERKRDGRSEFFHSPHLKQVWSLAVKKELKRRGVSWMALLLSLIALACGGTAQPEPTIEAGTPGCDSGCPTWNIPSSCFCRLDDTPPGCDTCCICTTKPEDSRCTTISQTDAGVYVCCVP